jgi:hypothetical protein
VPAEKDMAEFRNVPVGTILVDATAFNKAGTVVSDQRSVPAAIHAGRRTTVTVLMNAKILSVQVSPDQERLLDPADDPPLTEVVLTASARDCDDRDERFRNAEFEWSSSNPNLVHVGTMPGMGTERAKAVLTSKDANRSLTRNVDVIIEAMEKSSGHKGQTKITVVAPISIF